MIVVITLITAGTDTGPFNLYSDLDGYTSAFETGVSKASLLAGYGTALVPDGTTIIRVMSDGECTNYIDIQIVPTTTTTTTVPDPPTATLTFDKYESGVFYFVLSDAIPSTDIEITAAAVAGFTGSSDCSTEADKSDSINSFSSITIGAGTTTGSQEGITPMNASALSYLRGTSITISGLGTFFDSDTVTIGGTLVTIDIDNACDTYTCVIYKEWVGARFAVDIDDVCAATPTTVYTAFGESITTASIVYTDNTLFVTLDGYNFIAEPVGQEIYRITSTGGVVEEDMLTNCAP